MKQGRIWWSGCYDDATYVRREMCTQMKEEVNELLTVSDL